MPLLIHVIFALGSMFCTALAYVLPSKAKLQVSASLVVLTLVSGTYLVMTTHSPLLSSCLAGLAYLGTLTIGLVAVRHKLALQK